MSSLEIIHCDPLSVSKRRYVARIPNGQWFTVKDDITALHRGGWKHKAILAYLKSHRGLNVTLGQLGSKMSDWKLFTYRTTSRCTVPMAPSETLFRNFLETTDCDSPSRLTNSKNAIVQVCTPHFQCSLPLYSSDDQGNLIPNWSAFLLRAAKGDSLAMKTICILAKSQRFKRTSNDYLVYQRVIEAVRSEMSSADALSLQISVMIFYAILALAIQAGFMTGQTSISSSSKAAVEKSDSTINEPAMHLNAAGYMLSRISSQTHQQGRQDKLKQLVDFFDVASYLLALSRCAQSEAAAWPLLMYRLIVE